mmetsp:Transcript_24953/g.50769  ORF Transcript_24953/g.50769 Transcript_24953/m.50769 type:complete len:297 (-) Transcript_24953:13-903(-)
MVFTAPSDPLMLTGSWNMKRSHCSHHDPTDERSPSYMLITVGRHTGSSLSATLMVLVTRSGMDASRFDPSFASFRKPLTIFRPWKSSSQYFRTRWPGSQPAPSMSFSSLLNMSSVNTSFTATSNSPGSSRNFSIAIMSLSYSGSSGYVIQYSNGLLLIAAMFQVAMLRVRPLWAMAFRPDVRAVATDASGRTVRPSYPKGTNGTLSPPPPFLGRWPRRPPSASVASPKAARKPPTAAAAVMRRRALYDLGQRVRRAALEESRAKLEGKSAPSIFGFSASVSAWSSEAVASEAGAGT